MEIDGGKTEVKHGDRALALIGNEQVELTEEDSRRICRKTDRVILAILVWVYFLQILDKSVLGYGATYGLKTDTNLTGNEYSLVGSIAPIAQLAWQPFSSYLIVKVPHRILMPCLILGWGIAQASMAACHNFSSLMAARFFLGLFEAGCLPLFSLITSQWYRRAEQPIRVAAWYGTNGAATIVAAALSYGLGHIQSDVLKEWQMYVSLQPQPISLCPSHKGNILIRYTVASSSSSASSPSSPPPSSTGNSKTTSHPPDSSQSKKRPRPSRDFVPTKQAPEAESSSGDNSSRPPWNQRHTSGSPWLCCSTSAPALLTPSDRSS